MGDCEQFPISVTTVRMEDCSVIGILVLYFILFKINVAKGGKRHLHATQLTKPCT